ELFVAHEHGADAALVIVEGVVEPAHIAPGDAEDHIDAGVLKHPDDALCCTHLRRDKLTDHGGCAPDTVSPLCGWRSAARKLRARPGARQEAADQVRSRNANRGPSA